jgi:hypothetical protein
MEQRLTISPQVRHLLSITLPARRRGGVVALHAPTGCSACSGCSSGKAREPSR